ncbi:MFS transporter [Xenorhabdus hominickii]|uniref:MFS transporter n=1 Tax=Xenorhabdus hominickii TaxID=351679 RepID=A0A2G0QE86_XENHO|nr:MFS transporter [Xenorhabdus hominickii]AOM41577.1 MFS transporter [Xenorhabdus hominickii]PHM57521.1 MFS transporter [Xenorhabdus hominickii]
MANLYRDLFRVRGTIGFTLAGFLGRLPLPMIGIGIIIMLSQLRGSYGLAGAVAATFVFTYAIIAPQVSRLVDRKGQGRILPITAIISVIGLIALVGCTYLKTPDWTFFIFAILAGFMPSMSAMTRARWTAIYRGKPELQTAYSLETVMDEISFIVGPPISVGLSVGMFPQAALIASATILAIGVFTFVGQRQTEPVVQEAAIAKRGGSVLRDSKVIILTLLLVAMGVVVGTVDIVSVAFAERQGQPAAASFVLSAYAIGSCIAGLVFGALKFSVPLPRLLFFGGLATAATTLPLLIVGNIPELSAAVLIAGIFFAPTMIVAMALIEQIVPESKLTEGLTWLLSGLNTGSAIGASVSGQIVDVYGVGGGFSVAVVAGVIILLTVAACFLMLRNARMSFNSDIAR